VFSIRALASSNENGYESGMRRCAHCGTKIASRAENPWAPFCSERCKLIDLGKWLGEEYRVPAGPRQEGEAQDSLVDGGGEADDEENRNLH
jgi:uncharacterized protein